MLMEPKTISSTLIAAACLLGLDRSIEILKSERVGISAAVDSFHKMTMGDLANAVHGETKPTLRTHGKPVATKRRRTPVTKPVATATLAPVLGVNPVTMHLAIKEELAKKKQTPIRFIMTALQAKKLVTDSAAARVAVEKFIREDKTFSCATRGVYRLRSKPV